MPPPAKTTAAKPAPGRPPSLTFSTMAEVLEIARGLYAGGVTPNGVDRPEKLVPILIAGAELGLGVMQSVESVYVLNGKTCLYGDVGKALILQSGLLEYQSEELINGGDDRAAVVTVKRVGQPEAKFRFALDVAKKLRSYKSAVKAQQGQWYDDPDNMLRWRARWRAWRSEFADVLRGLTGIEEAEDEPITVEATPAAPRPAPPPALPTPKPVSPPPPPAAASPAAGDAAEPPATADSPTATEAQIKELVRLRDVMFVALALSDKAEKDAAWKKVLAPFKVPTARQLTSGQADSLIIRIGHEHDPITYPAPY